MKRILLLLVVAVGLLVSCNKNQRAVKLLDGNWTATNIKVTNATEVIEGPLSIFNQTLDVTYDGCKLKEDEYCTQTTVVTYSVLGITETNTNSKVYRVTEKGTRLEVKENAAAAEVTIIDIVELTKDKLITRTESSDETVEIEYSKN